jgi:hypothetical protein
MTSKIIKANINDEDILVLVLRKRNKTCKIGYAPLIKNIVPHMTQNQLSNIINIYNGKKVIRYDDILDSFEVSKYMYEMDGYCICGKKIKNHYIITNTENATQMTVGSTCCTNWTDRVYTSKKSTSVLKKCFDVFKENRKRSPRIRYGKYEGRLYTSIIKIDYGYCNWLKNYTKDNKIGELMKEYIRYTK